MAIAGDVNSRWSFTERFKLGGPLANVLNLLPNLSTVFPVLPTTIIPGAVANTTHPYICAASHQDHIGGSFGSASGQQWKLKGGACVGAMTQLTSGLTMDVWAEYIPTSATVGLGGVASNGSATVSRETRIGAAVYW